MKLWAFFYVWGISWEQLTVLNVYCPVICGGCWCFCFRVPCIRSVITNTRISACIFTSVFFWVLKFLYKFSAMERARPSQLHCIKRSQRLRVLGVIQTIVSYLMQLGAILYGCTRRYIVLLCRQVAEFQTQPWSMLRANVDSWLGRWGMTTFQSRIIPSTRSEFSFPGNVYIRKLEKCCTWILA
jgi:hypothetical protein